MRKKITLMFVFFISVNMMSQEVCESPDESELDLNSITKCSIKESKNKRDKKTRQISVKVSASRRYLKKREALKKQSVSGATGVGLASVKNTTGKAEITKTLSLKNNIENLKEKLSAEEIKKASRFTTVDKLPMFKGCKKVKKSESMDCFNEEMINHISKHFRYPSKAVKESIQGEVWVRFIIDKNGDIRNIKTLGPKNASILNKEAVRVVLKLPKFIPAKKDGGRIAVKYGFPIVFALEE